MNMNVQGSHGVVILVGLNGFVPRRLGELGSCTIDSSESIGINESDGVWIDSDDIAVFGKEFMDGGSLFELHVLDDEPCWGDGGVPGAGHVSKRMEEEIVDPSSNAVGSETSCTDGEPARRGEGFDGLHGERWVRECVSPTGDERSTNRRGGKEEGEKVVR